MQRRTSSNSRKPGPIQNCAILLPETRFRAPEDNFRTRSGIPLHPKQLTQDGCANFAWNELVNSGVHQQLLRRMHIAPQACPRFCSLQHCTGMSVAGPSATLRRSVGGQGSKKGPGPQGGHCVFSAWSRPCPMSLQRSCSKASGPSPASTLYVDVLDQHLNGHCLN